MAVPRRRARAFSWLPSFPSTGAVADAPPLRLAFYRFALGGLVILAYAWWTRHRGVFDVRPGEWRVLLSLGVIFSVQIGFIVNSYLYKVYLASAIATCSLTTPLFGVLIAAAVTGDQLGPVLLLSSLMVAADIGLTIRR